MDAQSGMGRIAAALANDWQISGILTAGSAPRYDVTYQYQNNGANVNLTGSPDYTPRIVINGDMGSGCSSDRFSQFNTVIVLRSAAGQCGYGIGTQLPRGMRRSHARSGDRAQLQRGWRPANPASPGDVQRVQLGHLQLARDATAARQPANQTIRNSQFLPNGDVDPARLRTTSAGFGAVTGAQAMRAVQGQIRFQF